MNTRSTLKVPFVGLKEGVHSFEFSIGKEFFDEFDYDELHAADILVRATLDRQERMLIWDFDIDGSIRLDCDRCSEELFLPLKGTEHLIIKLGRTHEEESENVIIIPETEYEIDLRQHIYDYIRLLMPVKRVHEPGDDGSPGCTAELQEQEQEQEQETDPRWNALKELKNKLEK